MVLSPFALATRELPSFFACSGRHPMLTEMKQVSMALYVAHMSNICRQITLDVGHSNNVRANLDRCMHLSSHL